MIGQICPIDVTFMSKMEEIKWTDLSGAGGNGQKCVREKEREITVECSIQFRYRIENMLDD